MLRKRPPNRRKNGKLQKRLPDRRNNDRPSSGKLRKQPDRLQRPSQQRLLSRLSPKRRENNDSQIKLVPIFTRKWGLFFLTAATNLLPPQT
jgi:hypothetical protein